MARLDIGKQIFQRILVVDDDTSVVQLVKIKLESNGYDVLTAYSGEQALAIMDQQGLPHLAIIDINMPGMDGFELCQRIQTFSDLPVILLTAMNQEETVIRGIEHFAEDYITKPFSPNELVVRVRRVLRRIADFGYTGQLVTHVDEHLSIDFVHKRAFLDGTEIPLTPIETKILFILMQNAGHIVTHDFLLKRIWPQDEIYEDTLRTHIHRLRSKIERNLSAPHYVLTARGIGYTFFIPHK
ncbi:MAG: response regulator transcription factor [Caldilineaceae bacterium]|nr:response regulator transcription factor [Caldilineaceae bacterium]